jgi:alpha-tubulin suppressor-like RCC1 family protein
MNTRNHCLDVSVRRATGAVIALTLAAASFGFALPRAQPARAFDLPLTGVAKVVVGNDHACTLMLDKTIKCWGYNEHSALAQPFGNSGIYSSDIPLTIEGLGGDAFNIVAGNTSNCALLSDFSVQCWGNTLHRVGPGETPYWFVDSATPVQIGGLDGTVDVFDISAGLYHACVLNTSQPFNSGVCWGDNYWGQLGNSTIPQQPQPFFVNEPRRSVEFGPLNPVEISAGSYHTCARGDPGVVSCWGYGGNGRIGDGNNATRITPEFVDGLLSTVTDISAGDAHTCVVLSDGRVQCWGAGSNGQLGNNSLTDSNVATLAVIVNASQVSAGAAHTCARTRQFTVLCWGANGEGQLGDGSRTRSLTPQLVPGLDNVAAIDAGGQQTCALLFDTSVKCWGDGVLTPTDVVASRIEVDNTVPIDLGDVLNDVPGGTSQQQVPYESGDAPGSTAAGQDIAAYPGVPGRFPSLDDGGIYGPKHANPLRYYLGDATSVDAPVDADGVPNVDMVNRVANLDTGDDGWLNGRDILRFDDCQTVTLRIRIRRGALVTSSAPLYLNAWFDGNRDGDWQDSRGCGTGRIGREWIVQNHTVPNRLQPSAGDYVDIDVTTQPVASNSPANPAWMRISLSDRPAITPTSPAGALPDGRGMVSPYGYGETEDYLWDPITPSEQYGDWEIRKTLINSGPFDVGSTLEYSIEVRRLGGSMANVAAALVDVLPPQASFVSGVAFNEVTPTANPASAVYEAGYGGPNGRVRWTGTLSAGAQFRLRFQVRVNACTSAPVRNTAALILPGPGRVISTTLETPLSCTPPPPPSFALSKQMVDAIGSTTFSGGAQISETVYLLTLTQNNAPSNLATAIQDALPAGLRAVEVSASRGTITTTVDGRIVSWVGAVGPALAPPQAWIRAQVNGPVQCGRDLVNTGRYAVRLPDGTLAQGASGPVTFRPGCAPPPEPTPRPTTVPTTQPTNTPTPVATYTPTPRPTNTPVPVVTNTPVPRPTNTPVPAATYTPVPVVTNTPVPRPTNTPMPLPTDAPPGSPTNTPVPAATYTPVPVVTNTPVPVEPIGQMPVHVLLPIVVR